MSNSMRKTAKPKLDMTRVSRHHLDFYCQGHCHCNQKDFKNIFFISATRDFPYYK